jgi:hypothetical protein
MCSFGGVPLIRTDSSFEWAGAPATQDFFESLVIDGLGTSAVLTYDNKSNKSIKELGSMCQIYGHRWAYKWMTAGFLFVDQDHLLEMSMLRDCNFYQSWRVRDEGISRYCMNGTLAAWRKFTSNYGDASFDKKTNLAMGEIKEKFGFLWK